MGYQISRIRNTVLLQCWSKKRPAQKGYFWSQKYVFCVIFFFSYLKMVFCELMLLDLGDLLGMSLLRNSFSAASSIFSCKYFSKIAQYFQFFLFDAQFCFAHISAPQYRTENCLYSKRSMSQPSKKLVTRDIKQKLRRIFFWTHCRYGRYRGTYIFGTLALVPTDLVKAGSSASFACRHFVKNTSILRTF